MMLEGVFPASVTPFNDAGQVDSVSLVKLVSYFRAAGCSGVVLGGTNGEGPSLSAVEKRDLLKLPFDLPIILGIATPSLQEATWLAQQAGKFGALACLVLPPFYFRSAQPQGIESWFRVLLDESPVPIIFYNFPRMSGFEITDELILALRDHPKFGGLKDSSGDRTNLSRYRTHLGEHHSLMIGDETLLIEALQSGWTGTISGAANAIPQWLARIVWEFKHDPQLASTKFQLVLPLIQRNRALAQPATNKSTLHRLGLIETKAVRPPLTEADGYEMANMIKANLGIDENNLALWAAEQS